MSEYRKPEDIIIKGQNLREILKIHEEYVNFIWWNASFESSLKTDDGWRNFNRAYRMGMFDAEEYYKELVGHEPADLSNADLSNAYLKGCSLDNAKFINANLQNANLEEARLRGCDFSGADFANSNLKDARFTGANFSNAKNLTIKQLSQVFTLWKVEGLEIRLEEEIKKNYPKLLQRHWSLQT